LSGRYLILLINSFTDRAPSTLLIVNQSSGEVPKSKLYPLQESVDSLSTTFSIKSSLSLLLEKGLPGIISIEN
jgi:hypothetical protein